MCPVIQENLLDRTQICIFGLSNYAISLSIPMFGILIQPDRIFLHYKYRQRPFPWALPKPDLGYI